MNLNKFAALAAIGALAFAIGCGDDDDSTGSGGSSAGGNSAGGNSAGGAGGAEQTFGTDADIAIAEGIWTEITGFEMWSLMPNTVETEPSGAPHGSFATIRINATAEADLVNFADDSIIVKSNLTTEDATDIEAYTVMKKIAGYDADNDDWFWAKFEPDGTLSENPMGVKLAGAIGKGGTSGCIPCHSGDADYVFKN